MFIHFDRIHERGGRTDRQTPLDGIDSADRAAKLSLFSKRDAAAITSRSRGCRAWTRRTEQFGRDEALKL